MDILVLVGDEITKNQELREKFSTSKNLNHTKILRLSVANVLIWFSR